jgi:adenosylcobinamide-GDP ribazoletransferase
MLLAPLAVLPLGLAVALVAAAGRLATLPETVTALLAIGAVILGNRALHLDGLSDVTDGLTASFDRERSLEVMKSGTSGPAGVVATVLVVGLQVAALAAVLGSSRPYRDAVLAGVVVCVSRAALVICCTRGVRPARADGLGLTFTQTVERPATAAVWVGVAALLSALAAWTGLPWWRGIVAVAVALVVLALLVARTVSRFGGVTGDVFGAAVELAFAALLVALS